MTTISRSRFNYDYLFTYLLTYLLCIEGVVEEVVFYLYCFYYVNSPYISHLSCCVYNLHVISDYKHNRKVIYLFAATPFDRYFVVKRLQSVLNYSW